MTLNNLADHLSWLLSHVDLSHPTGPVLPTVHDAAFDTSRSFTSAISSQPAVANNVRPRNINNSNINNASRPSNQARAAATSHPGHDFKLAAIDDDDPFADEEEELADRRQNNTVDEDLFADEEEEIVARNTTRGTTITATNAAMGKLTTKATKKPSLLSKQDHLATPPTTAVGRLQQAYTASLSSKNGKLQQAYSASLSNKSSRDGDTPPAKKAKSPSRLSRTPSWISRPTGPARREAADLDEDEDMFDFDTTEVGNTMDPDATGCTTYVYGSPIPLWNEDAASRAEPPPSRGRKRKSSEMVGSSPRLEPMSTAKGKVRSKPKLKVKEEDDDEFPDVFDLVGEDLKTPAMIERRKAGLSSVSRRSPAKGSPPKVHLAASDSTILTQRTVTHTRSTTETTIHRTASRDRTPFLSSSATSMMAESPSGKGKTVMLAPPEPAKRPRTSSPAKSRAKQRSPSPMAVDQDFMSDGGIFDQPSSPSLEPSRPAGRFKRSDIIMDSDDDDDFGETFETPPTRNDSDAISFVTAGTGGAGSVSNRTHTSSREEAQEESKHTAAATLANTRPSWIDVDSSQSAADENAKSAGRSRAQDTDTAKCSQRADTDPTNEQRSPASTDDGTLIMDLFKEHSHALDILEKPVLDKLAQNTADMGRAFREKWPPERRNQIKLARPPLVKQKDAFADAKAAYTTYCQLHAKCEDLVAELVMAYDADQDIEELESRQEALSKEVEESEQALRRALVATGITVQSFNDLPDPPPQQQATVTQATGAGRSFSRTSSFIPECASQNIPQSQSGSRPPSRAVSSEQPPASARPPVPPFPREQLSAARLPPPSNRPSANASRAIFEDPTMDIEDFFDDDEDDWSHAGAIQTRPSAPPAARASSSTRPRPKSPVRPRSRHQDNFSDYGNSDDEYVAAMVAMAEVAEVRQKPSPVDSRSNRQRERSVLSEASGNSAPAVRARAVAMKTAVPKLKVPPELMRHPWSKDLLLAFKDRFRLTSFRHNQLEAINATLDGQDAFVLMPTGGGKSLCYQLPAVIHSGKTRGVTIVVTPLLSLMQDQVDHLRVLGIAAKAFNGDMDRAEKQDILSSFKMKTPENHCQLLYVTPEMINKSTAFLDGLRILHRNKKFARLVIDEAHCVSQWGHDFRPDYKELGQVRQQFPGVPVIALTATATHNVITDVKHNLSMQNCKVFSQSFNRANLYYEVRPKEKQSVETIAKLISDKYAGKTGIVYTLSRKQTEQIAQKLSDHGISAKHYHAAMPAADKTQVQRDWQSGRVKVVVATIAFGMGIDKPDVRFVVHQYLPKSLEGYYQETGRAGRDGLPSDCYLFFSHGDIFQLRKFIEDSDGNSSQKDRQKEMLNRVVMFCENTRDCRRSQLLHYFGETFANTKCRKTCDNCRNAYPHETEDRTEIAKAVLEAVMYYSRLTMLQCTDAVLGKKKNKDEELQPFHGAAKGLNKYEIFRIINGLAAEHALGEENRMGGGGFPTQYFIMGKNASQFLNGGRKLHMVVRNGGDKSAPAKTTKKKATKKAAADPASTCISSPVRGGARTSKKGKAVAAKYFDVEAIAEDDDDEVDKEDFGSRVARFTNGYAQDDFTVGDDDDEEDYFGPRVAAPPPKQRRQRTLEEQLAPQASAAAAQVAEPDEIQSLILEEFMRDATRLEEELRNNHNIRTPLFTEVQLQQMLIQWTNSTARMGRIQGIKETNVRKFGAKLIPLVDRYHKMYRDMCKGQEDESMATIPATAGPASSRHRAPPKQKQHSPEIVDLLSDEDDDDEDDDDYDDDEPGQPSKYFGAAGANDPFQNQLERWEHRFADAAQNLDEPAPSRGRSTYNNKKGGGGKKGFYKKGGGGSRGAGGRSYSGVSKRKSGGSTGAGASGRRTSGGSARSGGGASSRSGASTVKKSGGTGSGGSGIGIMPF